MRKLMLATLAAAIALPGMALADSADRAELRRDQARIANERRDLHEARHYGSPRDVREERREYHDAVREYREDRRDFRRDRWAMNHRYGDGRGYQRYHSGYYMPHGYWHDRYTVNYGRYARPGRHLRWVRYYDDMLLINQRTGRVVDVRYDVY